MHVKPHSNAYNFFFHPFHFRKTETQVATVITNIVLTLISVGLWQIPFWAVNRLDHHRVKKWKQEQSSKAAKQGNTIVPPTSGKAPSSSEKISEKVEFTYPGADLSNLDSDQITTLQNFIQEMSDLDPKESFVYVDTPFQTHDGKHYKTGWYSQAFLSYATGFSTDPGEKSPLQIAAEKESGPFLFVLSFSNCHSHIKVVEPSIRMPDPLPNGGGVTEFPNVEFYYQFCKRALVAKDIDHDEQKAFCNACRADIVKDEFKDPNEAYKVGREVAGDQLKLTKKGCHIWDKEKEKVMKGAIFAKFSQNPLLREMLKATSPHSLLQLKTDQIWGPGKDGKGLNLLGKCLMDVRQALIEGKTIEPHQI